MEELIKYQQKLALMTHESEEDEKVKTDNLNT